MVMQATMREDFLSHYLIVVSLALQQRSVSSDPMVAEKVASWLFGVNPEPNASNCRCVGVTSRLRSCLILGSKAGTALCRILEGRTPVGGFVLEIGVVRSLAQRTQLNTRRKRLLFLFYARTLPIRRQSNCLLLLVQNASSLLFGSPSVQNYSRFLVETRILAMTLGQIGEKRFIPNGHICAGTTKSEHVGTCIKPSWSLSRY